MIFFFTNLCQGATAEPIEQLSCMLSAGSARPRRPRARDAGNVYVVGSQASGSSNSFATGAFGWETLPIENPDRSDEDDAFAVASRGQVFRELLIHFGPGGWPAQEARRLRDATNTWLSLNEALREDVAELLWAGFNRLFPPESARAGEEWARVQWYEPIVAPNHIQSESADGRFIAEFRFTNDLVSVSYSGPVRFSLAVVQPATRHVFARQEVFITETGDWTASQGRFWPRHEALVLAPLVSDWARFAAVSPLHLIEAVDAGLWGAFNRLLMMLPAVGAEAHHHATDQERWHLVRWRPLEAAAMQASVTDGVQARSECGNFLVRWHFRTTFGPLEAVITWRGPVRFVRRWPPQPQAPAGGESVFEARHGPWPPLPSVSEEFETRPGDWPGVDNDDNNAQNMWDTVHPASFWPQHSAQLLTSTLQFQSATSERWASFTAQAPQAFLALSASLFVGFRCLMRHVPVSGDDW